MSAKMKKLGRRTDINWDTVDLSRHAPTLARELNVTPATIYNQRAKKGIVGSVEIPAGQVFASINVLRKAGLNNMRVNYNGESLKLCRLKGEDGNNRVSFEPQEFYTVHRERAAAALQEIVESSMS